MAAVAALLALLAPVPPVSPVPVSVPQARYVALPFQPVLLRCRFPPAPDDVPPIVTWKFKAPCPRGGDGDGDSCPVRIVAAKQGDTVTLGDAYRGRGVTIRGGADLSLGAAAWGDSGTYVCTVSSTGDLSGDNEGHTDLLVLDWLFVVLVLLGAALGALALGLCWCQCCPHSCCCLVRCPCCPQRCCCPEALYWAGKAATSGGGGGAYGHAPPPIPLHSLVGHTGDTGATRPPGGSHAPLLGDAAPPLPLLRFLEPTGAAETAPPPSDVTSLHEPPDAWVPPPNSWVPPPDAWVPPSPLPPSRGRCRSAEVLAGSPGPRPRSRSRDDWLEPAGGGARGGGAKAGPRPHGSPRRLRKNDALSRESLVV
ncbi:lipolysis-stimulated lipoprotein receptor-like isoform X1 [Caloenas nicobarica]|uniref:lipolysis-stimulated lipoprotein receptor-like isoform X1 n=1 Tax=Caloenas nicobarica TaxID=187106 RepID=UPI0032B79BA6